MSKFITKYKTSTLTKLDISKISLNNQYQVNISGITGNLKKYLEEFYHVDRNYVNGTDIGIMCSEATLPTSSFATAEVKDNHHGVNQQFAHTRLYIDSDFTFYVDYNYNVIKFFEGWMDYIAGDSNLKSVSKLDEGAYYRRFNYPMNNDRHIGYKSAVLSITKFDKNHENWLSYDFINSFPKGMTSVPVTYGGADALKVTVQFAYDRYVIV